MTEASSTQQDSIYATLRQWITVGRFLPGERLKIRNVAADMGVGHMPVRAALQRLAAEGALVNSPNAGVAVPQLSAPEFDDLLQMRMLLEGEAAERGSMLLDATQLATMKSLCERMDQALADNRPADYLAANEDFHVLLYRAAGSPILFNLIDTLWLRAGPISNHLFDTPQASQVLNDAHRDGAVFAPPIGQACRRSGKVVERSECVGNLGAVFIDQSQTRRGLNLADAGDR